VVRTGGINIGAYQASASAFLVGVPRRVHVGVPFDVSVTAVDSFGQVAVGYTGTVTFSTSDSNPDVVLLADYPFTLGDAGVQTFTNTGLGETTLHQGLRGDVASRSSYFPSGRRLRRARACIGTVEGAGGLLPRVGPREGGLCGKGVTRRSCLSSSMTDAPFLTI
jgi:hypothetical protein